MKKILIAGYFFQKNWGDTMFERIFKERLGDFETTLIKLQNLIEYIKNDFEYDFIIIGGGELINEYYLNDKLFQKIKNIIPNIPIFFIGVSKGQIEKLDIGDHFFIRNKSDYNELSKRFGHDYTHYTPDLVFELAQNNTSSIPKTTINNLTLSLAYPQLYNNKYADDYINSVLDTVSKINPQTVTFVCLDSSTNPLNGDIYAYNMIKEKIQNITLLECNEDELIKHFQETDFVLGARFHSIVLSVVTRTPFIALCATDKLKKLSMDLGDLSYRFIDIEKRGDKVFGFKVSDTVFENIKNADIVRTEYEYISQKMTNYTKALDKTWNNIIGLLNKDQIDILRQNAPQYFTRAEKDDVIQKIIFNVLKMHTKTLTVADTNKIMKGASLMTMFPRQKDYSNLKKTLTEEILWNLTNDPYSSYYYGLYENILSNKFIEQLRWIVDDYYKTYYFRNIYMNDNVTLINKNFQEVHRSGWQYIVDKIVMKMNTETSSKKIILDTYVDKTFHWNKTFYASKRIIPYKEEWVGFIHHTFSDYNNNYNCAELVKNKLFLDSLPTCKGLIVMTKYLKLQLEIVFARHNINVPIYNVYHPTEFTENVFDFNTFIDNRERKIVQIGNWMRDMFAIHRLEIPPNSIIRSKAVLKNKNSDNYFLPETFFDMLFENIKNAEVNSNVYDICKISLSNMHLKSMYNNILEMENSVEILQRLPNDEYDKLLTENIIFLYLADASAVNTIIECIVRNTPILVNKIPPTIELLGEDYPLFYENYFEASYLLSSSYYIEKAYEYLLSYDKTRYYIKTFINDVTDILRHTLS